MNATRTGHEHWKAKSKKLHAQLDKAVQEVVREKRILLFKEMLMDIGYDDMSVVLLLTLGVRVVGKCENTGI